MKNKFIYITLFLFIFIAIGCFFINRKETIAIISAMDAEINEVSENLSNAVIKEQNNFKIIIGYIGKHKIILSKAGIGKVNAATTTQFIIDKYKPNYIINIGLAGGISPNAKIGDVIIAEKMVQHDFDVTAFGCPKGYMDNGIEPDKPTFYYSDKTLISKFAKDKNINKGTIATGDIFVTDIKLKHNINKEFNADAIDMESAAIAQTAGKNKIPVIILRSISDSLYDTTNEYKQNKKAIAKKPAIIVTQTLESDK